ncbi:MAG: type II toxin-antitoxin system RelB/DinJ family antitoxin [Patescibacteria group bacterium]
MNNTTTIQVRIDAKTKREARKVFDGLGLDFSSAVKVYLRQVAREKSLPFRPGRTVNGFTPEYEQKILKEEAWALKYARRYNSVDEALRALWSKKK